MLLTKAEQESDDGARAAGLRLNQKSRTRGCSGDEGVVLPMPCTRLLLANRSSASAGADERVRRQRRRRLTAAGTIALRQCDRRAGGAVRGRRTAEFGRRQERATGEGSTSPDACFLGEHQSAWATAPPLRRRQAPARASTRLRKPGSSVSRLRPGALLPMQPVASAEQRVAAACRPKRYGVLAEIELVRSRADCSSRGNAVTVPSCP
jgi:hypothetical protein